MQRNGHVDLLRGLSIIAVLLGHSLRYGGFWVESFPPTTPSHIVEGAYFGVTAFFVISGFLITGKFIAAESQTLGVDAARFYIQRIGRIIPPLALLLCVSIGLAIASGQAVIPSNIPGALFALLTLDFDVVGKLLPHVESSFDPLWSLRVEEIFYVLFPILCMLTVTRTVTSCALAAAVVLGLISRLSNSSVWIFFAAFDQIAIGCLVAMQGHRIKALTDGRQRQAAYLLSMILLIILYYKLSPFTAWAPTAVACAAGMTIIFAPPNRAFERAIFSPLKAIGYLSYEIYLVHIGVMYYLSPYGLSVRSAEFYGYKNWIFLLAELGLIVAMAYAIERYFSKPANRYIRRALEARLPFAPGLKPVAEAARRVQLAPQPEASRAPALNHPPQSFE